jgi:DNA primase
LTDEQTKGRVLESTDLVELIGQHIALRPKGREFAGLCPFHDDTNPSLYVSPTKQIYKCFVCGAGGDALSFITHYHKMSFPEALAHLAERAGIELPRHGRGAQPGEGMSNRQRILEANKKALSFFRNALRDERAGAVARQYLAERGIDDEMIEAFQLGCAPDRWDALAERVQRSRWDREAFEMAGLIAPRRRGNGYFDKLRHRLIFPILDNIGRPIAFGGRVLPVSEREDKTDAKYLNSPEHDAFHKSATLFGLHRAQRAIIDSRTAVLVEGYTDVLAAHRAGFSNAVATLGTALTRDHARLLRRYCDRVLLVFDADEAGQRAADRALEVFFQEPLDVDIAILPEGLDPADLLGKDDGPDRFQGSLDAAEDAMAFQFRRVRRAFDQTETMAGRQRITEQYLQSLVRLGLRRLGRQRYGLVFARLAELLGMSPAAVKDAVGRIEDQPGHDQSSANAAARQQPTRRLNAAQRAERYIIGCLLNGAELFHAEMPDGMPLDEAVVPDDFSDEAHRKLYGSIYKWLADRDTEATPEDGEDTAQGRSLQPAELRPMLEDEDLLQLALNLQLKVDELTEGSHDRRVELLRRSASAVVRNRDEQEYQHEKQRMRRDPTVQDAPPETEVERRLNLVRQHHRPNAGRVVRPLE